MSPKWPILTALAGLALSYNSRLVTRIVWFVCGLVWLVWLSRLISGPDPEDEDTKDLKRYRAIGGLIAEGYTLRAEVGQFASGWRDPDDPDEEHPFEQLLEQIVDWKTSVADFLRENVSSRELDEKTLPEPSEWSPETIPRILNLRIDFLRKVRDDLYERRWNET